MYELNNKVRLIDVSEYVFSNTDEFYGFLCGVISQDHDLQQVYFDNFIKIGCIDKDCMKCTLDKFNALSDKYNITFVMSIAVSENDLPEEYKSNIIISL